MKPKIAKFGFEIEGEMCDELARELVDRGYGDIKGDMSIRRCRDSIERGDFHDIGKHLNTYEFASKPIEEGNAGRMKAGKIFFLFEKHFREKGYHWNDSMGMHIHVSFKPRIPVDIWSVQFANLFYEKMKERFPRAFKKRSANTRYCRINKNKREIVEGTDRYVAINYRSAMNKFGTVEFRIFPAERPMTMRRYFKFTLDFVKDFIENSHLYLNENFDIEFQEEPIKDYNVIDVVKDQTRVHEVVETIETKRVVKEVGGERDLFKELKNGRIFS